MVHYRRARIPGATYFFTAILRDRRSDLLLVRADLLRQVFRDVRRKLPFAIDAVVILPDHIHAIWTLPPGDADYSGRWRAIKARFTRALAKDGIPLVRNTRGEYDLWQRRFWEHLIRDDDDFARHADYIHHNPVKHRLVANPFDWRLSSIHAYARRGIVTAGWQGGDQNGMFRD
jgi:putative transposase